MLISDLLVVRSPQERVAWSSLQRFQNVPLVTDILMQLHGLSLGQKRNAQKQARQIRYCLMQAREYAAAAGAVSPITKPTLLYYALMNLALAEMLLKQPGDSSLDRAREHHRHHGLVFTDTRSGTLADNLTISAAGLVAKPMIVTRNAAEERLGTFELWHRGAREFPHVGKQTVYHLDGGQTSGFRLLGSPDDQRLPLLPASGLTLFDCFTQIPDMIEFLGEHGIPSQCARGRITRDDHPQQSVLRYVLHPSLVAPNVFADMRVHPALVDRLEYIALPNGGALTLRTASTDPDHAIVLPAASAFTASEFRCWTSTHLPLNEFGFIYVALFMAGNYARYYPDRWVSDVETSAPLALAIEALLTIAERRVPWLVLSELSRSYHVFAE
ncbi:YaaC family protein [Bradyrhizobium sp. BR 1433]|uniref:YaaC family protein n=1 Tax=Bradyrhizobium sp. BR 1433 TaxID=3447967 RepID=UPI003EE6A843